MEENTVVSDNRRRNIIIIAVLAVVLFVLVIFFISRLRSNSANSGNNTPSAGTVTLQWWGTFLDPAVVQPLIDEYEALNRGVEVQYVNKWPGGNRAGAEASYYDVLDAALESENTLAMPDIFMVDNTMVGYYERKITAAPNTVITPNDIGQNFYPVVSANFVRSQQVLGLPLWIDSLAIVYNRTLLDAAGVTQVPSDWIEFRNLAQRLTTTLGTTKVFGFAAGNTGNTSFSAELLQLLVRQNNATFTDSRGAANFDSADFANALTFLKSFTGEGGSWLATNENDALAFAKGELAMIVAPSWRLNDILQAVSGAGSSLNVGVAAMPQIIGSGREINWATYWGNLVANGRPNSVAAWQFLNWLTQPEQLRKLRQSHISVSTPVLSFIYPRIDMSSELQSEQNLRPYLNSLTTAESWYTGNGVNVKASLSELIQSSGTSSNIQSAESKVQEALTDKL